MYRELEKTAKSLAKRVIFITGDVMESATNDFLNTTRATYITKPFDINQLKEKVKAILGES